MSNPFPGPIPPYNNPPIEPQYFQPSRFVISAISMGATTTITTTTTQNYVIGQLVRLLIPEQYGAFQLNNQSGYVVAIPSTTQVTLNIDSTRYDTFIPSPFVATITNITKSNPGVVTAVNAFVPGTYVVFDDVGGMTELNDRVEFVKSSNSTSFTINLDTSSYLAYTSGGTATLQPTNSSVPQIMAIGDINSGNTNANGNRNTSTLLPGSFQNISPA